MSDNPSRHVDTDLVHGHVSSPAQLIGVFVALLALTGLTVSAASWQLGDFDVWVSLGIAGLKATLVAAYYMHLRYDHPTNAVLLIFSVFVVVLFLGLTLSDTLRLAPELDAASASQVESV